MVNYFFLNIIFLIFRVFAEVNPQTIFSYFWSDTFKTNYIPSIIRFSFFNFFNGHHFLFQSFIIFVASL